MKRVTARLYQHYVDTKAEAEKLQAEIRQSRAAIEANENLIAHDRACMKEIEEAMIKLGTTIATAAHDYPHIQPQQPLSSDC
jgi:hypothetical protein